MRIEFKTEGGIAAFPGLSKPVTIESDELPEEEASELERQVDAARFFELPETASSKKRGAADNRQYTITVERGGQRHTIQLTDPVTDPALQELLNSLRTKAKGLRAAARARPPGTPPDTRD